MGIIVKYLMKNIGEKKLRTFLILLAIILSSGVFFASLAISDSLYDMILGLIKGYFGNCDIIITASEKSPSPFFYTAKAEKYQDRLEYIIGEVSGSPIYKPNKDEQLDVNLKGIDIDKLQLMNPFTLEQQGDLYPFAGRKIVINSSTAKEYGLKVGDVIDLQLGDSQKTKFKICGIAAPMGFFKSDGKTLSAVVPKDTAASIFDARGKSNMVYIKLKNPEQKAEMIKLLSEEYKNYRVDEPVPFEEIKRETSEISIIFMMLSCVVFFMSIFIIYSSFKVISVERLPAIGTFRSIGATKRMTNRLLLGESMAYGVIGGLIGCVVGIGILYAMSVVMSGMITDDGGMGVGVSIRFSPSSMIMAFVMAVVLCFAGSIVPIIKVSRISVKDIVLNMVEKTKKNKKAKLAVGIISVVLAFVMASIKEDSLRPAAAGAGMILSMCSIVLLVPYLTNWSVRLFEGLFERVFGNIGVLAAKNLRENKNLINNISMLAIGISSLLMINTAGYDSAAAATDEYKNTKYDIEIYSGNMDRDFLRMVQNIDGVSEVYGDYDYYSAEIVGTDKRITRIKSAGQSRFFEFWDLRLTPEQRKAYDMLDSGRNMMMTTAKLDELKLKVGDTVRLKMKSGEREYKIIGSFEKLQNSRNCVLISERFLKSDMQLKTYSGVFVKTYKNAEEVEKTMAAEFKRWRPFIRTKEQNRDEWMKSNEQSMLLLSGFSLIASFIGIFGIINNLILSFIERRHSMAVFRSMGMSKRQTVSMIFIEAATGGIIGGLIGILGGILLITVVAGVNQSAEVHYPVSTFILYMIAGAVIMLLASISPALRSSKLNLIDEIKYE